MPTINHEIPLGSVVKEKVTGFKGTVTGIARYLTGCNQYCVVPEMKEDAKEPPSGSWYDEGRLEIVGDGVSEKEVKGVENGGPVSDAPYSH